MPRPTRGPRLGAGPDHQALMLGTMAAQLFTHERIRTTLGGPSPGRATWSRLP